MPEIMPPYAFPITLHLCMDSRKQDCKFYNQVTINTKYTSFKQGFCGYSYRLDQDLTPDFHEKEEK